MKSVHIRSFSGPNFRTFELTTERYSISLCMQSECGEIRTRITPNKDTFYAVLTFNTEVKPGNYQQQPYFESWRSFSIDLFRLYLLTLRKIRKSHQFPAVEISWEPRFRGTIGHKCCSTMDHTINFQCQGRVIWCIVPKSIK